MGAVYAGESLGSFKPDLWNLTLGPRCPAHNQTRYDEDEGLREPASCDQPCRSKWREDGFTSLDLEKQSCWASGPIESDGCTLKVDFWTQFGGEVRVELVDARGAEMFPADLWLRMLRRMRADVGRRAGSDREVVRVVIPSQTRWAGAGTSWCVSRGGSGCPADGLAAVSTGFSECWI